MGKTYQVKPFQNGGSQAIRIPAEFRFEGEVLISRNESNNVIEIRQANSKPLERFFNLLKTNPELGADFEAPIREPWRSSDPLAWLVSEEVTQTQETNLKP